MGQLPDFLNRFNFLATRVYRGVIIKPLDEWEQSVFTGIRRQTMLERSHPDLDGALCLVAHVNITCGILANKHNGEPG
jgi:hypothetical protein